MPYRNRVRLMLVDDHPVMRAGLANLLALEKDFQIVAQADDGESAVALWQQHRPDVCLLDVSMHGIDGIETMRRLRTIAPEARVLMLTSSEAPEDMAQSLKAGAAGYVTKNLRHEELVAAIREVHAGGRPISSAAALRLAAAANDRRLSERELEVLRLLRDGCSHDDICARLTIADRTVRAHVSAIKEKLAAASAAQCVARAYELGIFGG